jgi:hypothetical protein
MSWANKNSMRNNFSPSRLAKVESWGQSCRCSSVVAHVRPWVWSPTPPAPTHTYEKVWEHTTVLCVLAQEYWGTLSQCTLEDLLSGQAIWYILWSTFRNLWYKWRLFQDCIFCSDVLKRKTLEMSTIRLVKFWHIHTMKYCAAVKWMGQGWMCYGKFSKM